MQDALLLALAAAEPREFSRAVAAIAECHAVAVEEVAGKFAPFALRAFSPDRGARTFAFVAPFETLGRFFASTVGGLDLTQ